jgi:hypothetical protein
MEMISKLRYSVEISDRKAGPISIANFVRKLCPKYLFLYQWNMIKPIYKNVIWGLNSYKFKSSFLSKPMYVNIERALFRALFQLPAVRIEQKLLESNKSCSYRTKVVRIEQKLFGSNKSCSDRTKGVRIKQKVFESNKSCSDKNLLCSHKSFCSLPKLFNWWTLQTWTHSLFRRQTACCAYSDAYV